MKALAINHESLSLIPGPRMVEGVEIIPKKFSSDLHKCAVACVDFFLEIK